MFDDIRIARRLRADASKIAVPGTDSAKEKDTEQKRYARFTVKCAVSAALVFAVMLGGALWLPTRQTQPTQKPGSLHTSGSSATQVISHDFVLQAYAADTANISKKKVTLALNMKVTLPTGKLRFHRHNGMENGRWTSGSDYQANGFLCSGKNLVSVKYTAAYGTLRYFSSELVKQERAAAKRSLVCRFKIAKSKIGPVHLIKSFLRLWKSGALDEYRKKYLNHKDIDLKRYSVTITTAKASYSEGGFSGGFDASVQGDANNDWVTIKDSKKYNFNDKLLFGMTKSITAKASDHDASVDWSPSDKAWAAVNAADKRYEQTGKVDYSGISGDRITVTGTFTDGQKLTKYINLTFNKSGYLCAKLTDK
jgi:hypothetical protein